MFLKYYLLLPLERVRPLVVGGDEVIHVFAELARTGEAGSIGKTKIDFGKKTVRQGIFAAGDSAKSNSR
ncbi:MAG TPA: hypothetical protein VIH91_02855 [Terriglobales bacterium]